MSDAARILAEKATANASATAVAVATAGTNASIRMPAKPTAPAGPVEPAAGGEERLPLTVDTAPCDSINLLHAAKYAMLGDGMRDDPLYRVVEAWHCRDGHPYAFEMCRQQPCHGVVQAANCPAAVTPPRHVPVPVAS